MGTEEDTYMSKAVLDTIYALVDRINTSGCRITIPYAEPSPVTVMFDGDFSGAEFIPVYPATLHIFGISGHVAVQCMNSLQQIRHDKFVVNFGAGSQRMDMLVKILE